MPEIAEHISAAPHCFERHSSGVTTGPDEAIVQDAFWLKLSGNCPTSRHHRKVRVSDQPASFLVRKYYALFILEGNPGMPVDGTELGLGQ